MKKSSEEPKKKKPAAKKPAAKKPAAKKPAAKKPSTKKVVAVTPEDPSRMKPTVFRKPSLVEKVQSTTLTRMMTNVRKSIEVIGERSKKRPVTLLTPSQLRRALMPYDELPFQNMLNSLGFRTQTAIEIVAPEKIGATTFVMDWISRLLDMSCYSVYVECEGKPMEPSRIKRLMDRDPKIATLKMNAVEWAKARTLAELDNTIRQTVPDLRKRCDADPSTKGNPIFVFVDPWGALLSKGEAKGNSDWGLAANAKKEAAKDTTDGSNFEHAKHAQGMARWLPVFMETHNCTVVFVNKQNDKVDFKAIPGLPAPSPMKNDTRIGGKALKRVCAYRMTMLKLQDIREKGGNKRVYGHNIRVMMIANSYGPRDRTCEFTIYFDNHDLTDTPEYQSPGLTFDDRYAAWMATNKYLSTTVDNELYTCDALGCIAVPAATFIAALRNRPDHIEYIGSQLGIEGYSSPVTDRDPTPVEDDGEPEGDLPADEDEVPADEDEVPADEDEVPSEEDTQLIP